MRRNGSDAASKLRFLVCPIFGFIVGGVPGRVFQNCKKIFSCPRHALKPPLICLHVRYRTHELRLLTTKVLFFAVTAKFGGLPGQISKNSFYIFLPPRHALKPPLICLLIRQQVCAQWAFKKSHKTPNRSLYMSRTVYIDRQKKLFGKQRQLCL